MILAALIHIFVSLSMLQYCQAQDNSLHGVMLTTGMHKIIDAVLENILYTTQCNNCVLNRKRYQSFHQIRLECFGAFDRHKKYIRSNP